MKCLTFIKCLLLILIGGIACYQPVAERSTSSHVSPETSFCRTIQHEVGETDVCGQPQKIIALGPYVLEFLLVLGLQPAGFADHMQIHQGVYDVSDQQIPYLSSQISQPMANVGQAFNPSIEAILKVSPDLILGTEYNAEQYATLSKIAPTVLIKWADLDSGLRITGQAVDRAQQAEQLLIETKQQIEMASELFAPVVATHPKMMLLSSSQFQEIFLGNTAHGLCSSLIEALGFELVAPKGFEPSGAGLPAPVSLEILPQLNEADLAIILGSNTPQQFKDLAQFEEHQLRNLKQAWEKNEIAQSLDVSKAGRVHFIPAYLCLGLPGPIGTELYLEQLKQQLL